MCVAAALVATSCGTNRTNERNEYLKLLQATQMSAQASATETGRNSKREGRGDRLEERG